MPATLSVFMTKVWLFSNMFLSNWSVNNVLNNTKSKLVAWGGILMMITGVIMCLVGIFKIAQALISHGKTQVNWVVNILLILIGALFCVGGTFFAKLTASDGNGIGSALENELNNLGQSSP